MNNKSWYLVFILSILIIFINLLKLFNAQIINHSFDAFLGIITGIGLLVASHVKIKNNSNNQ